MSKFLNEEGLSYFWGKVKDFLKSKYVAIGDAITVGKSTMDKNGFSVKESEEKYSTMDSDALIYNNGDDYATRVDANGVKIMGDDPTVGINIGKNVIEAINEEGYQLTAGATGVSASGVNNDYSALSSRYLQISTGRNGVYIEANDNGVSISKTDENKNTTTSKMNESSVTSPKFVKTGGTAVQILMADGSVKTLNAANGVPTLDANGKIPLEQLGNIDTTLFQVVTALPTSNIVKNRIYLVKSSSTTTQNIYAEYIYTGDVSATYDASKWEKLGEYKSDVDLSSYSKKSQTVNSINYAGYSNEGLLYRCTYADGVNAVNPFLIPKVEYSTGGSGLMSASDKKALDTLAARYPLSIASLTASPNLLEVGKSSDITFSWSFNNTDFHPITAQTIAVDGAAAVTVDKANKSYKQTALAGATTATTKSAVLKVNDSLTKSVNITYHYPSYIGVVANGATVDATAVKALTKSIEWGKGKTSAISQTNQKIVYAYPVSYGDLTSIKDGNGFQGFSGYTKQTLTIDGQNYNVYVQNIAATSSSTYTFA